MRHLLAKPSPGNASSPPFVAELQHLRPRRRGLARVRRVTRTPTPQPMEDPRKTMGPPQRVAFRHPRRRRFLSRANFWLSAWPPRGPRFGLEALGRAAARGTIAGAWPLPTGTSLLGIEPSRSAPRRRPSARERWMAPSTSRRCKRPPIVGTGRGDRG